MSKSIEYIEIGKDEAIQLLDLRLDKLMEDNPNWHSIAVVKDDSGAGYCYDVTVYDLRKERELIEDKKKRGEFIQKSDDFLQYLQPITVGFGQRELKNKVMNDVKSFPEIWVKINAIQVSIKIPATIVGQTPSKRPRARVMSDRLVSSDKPGQGSLGGNFLANDRRYYAVTAYHVVGNTLIDCCPERKITVSSLIDNIEEEIGDVVWCMYDEGYFDIAIVRYNDGGTAGSGSVSPGFKSSGTIGDTPCTGECVRICSNLTNIVINDAKVTSVFACSRSLPGSSVVQRGLVQTEGKLAEWGDSGSLVLDDKDNIVGVVVIDHDETASYFMPFDLLKQEITITVDRKPEKIKIETFL